MKFDQLTGAELDYWVALAEGFPAELRTMHGLSYCRIDVIPSGHQVYEPTKNSQLAGEIAFRRHYTLYPRPVTDGGALHIEWLAEAQLNPRYHGMFSDRSPHVAICRLRVAEAFAEGEISKHGAAARVPDHVYEARALRIMTDEQADQCWYRWRSAARV